MAKPASGTKGDDIFDSEDGFTDINGKKGFDLVNFTGSYGDYLIETKDTGNYKTTVSSTSDHFELKQIEMLRFDEGTSGDSLDDTLYDIVLGTTIRADNTLDDAARNSSTGSGNPFHGSGNDPHNYVTVDQEDQGLQLGLQIKERGGPSYDPVALDNDGTVHFNVDGGPGSSPNRADWSFDYSIATNLNGDGTDLADFTFKLLIDIDPSTETSYRVLTMEPTGGAPVSSTHPEYTGTLWRDQDGIARIGDDEGVSPFVTQNSQNYGFGFIHDFIDSDSVTPGVQSDYAFTAAEFDIELQAFAGADLVAVNHVVVHVDGFGFS